MRSDWWVPLHRWSCGWSKWHASQLRQDREQAWTANRWICLEVYVL